ncbi:SDR family NAD(P)-dependent oxidoreductase [Kangiella sp. TOML190]|uniref:SDR family NAD(P)-dependent oxidoreductase n=1 Tax=Kangiella sp. TOML190 TaxID=2931351 RepID=UPI0020419587|nr:SDR family NAD(P)-dependent oxidoreductase [Kangiella sp. TOML190]
MSKTILITGATDGIGFETAKKLVKLGHTVLLHGRSSEKLAAVEAELSSLGKVETYKADLSDLEAVTQLSEAIESSHKSLDVLLNNAGVLNSPSPTAKNGFDIRFVVNTLAPYLLSKKLLPLLTADSRTINLSSAAQSPIDLAALKGEKGSNDNMNAYAQSKLAITMWSNGLAKVLGQSGAQVISVNPGSLLASKMVKEGFGVEGKDLNIGADILVRAALSDEFASASGKYFDNDIARFSDPHPDALDSEKCLNLLKELDSILKPY